MNRTIKTIYRLEKLTALLTDRKRVLIVMQDNPDPDAIAAAVALRELAKTISLVSTSIAHGGTVGRAENRALVRYLGLKLHPLETVDLSRYDLIAMVDTQPGTGNNSLPLSSPPNIIIDHHPQRTESRRAQLSDIRKQYGSTSTILFEYLSHADIKPDPPLATALLYGIRSDTQDLGMAACQADFKALHALYPLANTRMLSEIQRGRVQRVYYKILYNALQNATVYGKGILTQVGSIDIPDMVGEVADLLLRDDETTWALCLGYYQDRMLLSIRTSETTANAAKIMRTLVSGKGTGGGHDMLAGGQIPLNQQTKAERQALEKTIRDRFRKAMGNTGQRGSKLITS